MKSETKPKSETKTKGKKKFSSGIFNVERLLKRPAFYRDETAAMPHHAPWERTEALVARAKSELHITPALELYLRYWLCPSECLRRRLTAAQVAALCDEVWDTLARAIIAQGEMVGAIASSSIGEPCTQMTLNTFHSAGIATKNITLGIPRFKELIDVSKNMKTPSLTMFLRPPFCRNAKLASIFAVSIQHTMLKSIVTSSQLVYEDVDIWSTAVEEDQAMLDLRRHTLEWQEEAHSETLSTWTIRFVLDCEKMESAGLTMERVEDAVLHSMGAGTVQVISSDQNMLRRVVRVRMYDLHQHIQIQKVAQTQEECTYLEKIAMQQLQNHLLDTVYIQGLKNIDKAIPRQVLVSAEAADGALETQSEWIIDTEGTNLQRVLSLPEVDSTRTVSNDVMEMYTIFGIEMANTILANEIRHVLSFDGTYVNDRHIQLLVDTMTFRGFLCPVSRHGMAKSALGPLMRSSFEETVDVLLDAAVYAEKDMAKGVTENIMLGNLAPIGTGAINLDCSHPLCRPCTRARAREPPPQVPEAAVSNPAAAAPAAKPVDTAPAQPSRFIGRKRSRNDACPPAALPPVSRNKRAQDYSYCPSSPTLIQAAPCGHRYIPSSPRLINLA